MPYLNKDYKVILLLEHYAM